MSKTMRLFEWRISTIIATAKWNFFSLLTQSVLTSRKKWAPVFIHIKAVDKNPPPLSLIPCSFCHRVSQSLEAKIHFSTRILTLRRLRSACKHTRLATGAGTLFLTFSLAQNQEIHIHTNTPCMYSIFRLGRRRSGGEKGLSQQDEIVLRVTSFVSICITSLTLAQQHSHPCVAPRQQAACNIHSRAHAPWPCRARRLNNE